jgi:hypothetical protein
MRRITLRFDKAIRQQYGFSFLRFGRAKTIVLPLVMFLGLVIVTWAGGDPWKKPYQQWDSKDILKIVNDSPWAKIVHVEAVWMTDPGVNDTSSAIPTGSMHPGQSTQGPSSSGRTDAGRNGQGSQFPLATFLVRWVSSRTIREAAVRNSVLSGAVKEEDAEKELTKSIDVYQVTLMGSNMEPFAAANEDELKNGAFLTTKGTKQKIVASAVQVVRSTDGKSVKSILFSFPKKSASGESTIGSDEKGVDLTIAVRRVNIPVPFEISKMDDAQGRDL